MMTHFSYLTWAVVFLCAYVLVNGFVFLGGLRVFALREGGGGEAWVGGLEKGPAPRRRLPLSSLSHPPHPLPQALVVAAQCPPSHDDGEPMLHRAPGATRPWWCVGVVV